MNWKQREKIENGKELCLKVIASHCNYLPTLDRCIVTLANEKENPIDFHYFINCIIYFSIAFCSETQKRNFPLLV